MEWQVMVAMVVAIPIIVFPAAFLWYVSAGGLYQAVRASRERKAGQAKAETVVEERVLVGTARK
jgi:hypothetical protein